MNAINNGLDGVCAEWDMESDDLPISDRTVDGRFTSNEDRDRCRTSIKG